MMMWARGISEFGAVVILAYHPKIAPLLVYERFEGFGLQAALPVTLLLILAALVVFSLLHWVLLPERDASERGGYGLDILPITLSWAGLLLISAIVEWIVLKILIPEARRL